MGAAIKGTRYTLICFNVLFLLIGAFLLGLGLYAKIEASLPPNIDVNEVNQFYSSANYLICLGCFIFLVALAGCCGSWYQTKWLLALYIAFLFLSVVAQLILLVFVVMQAGNLDEEGVKQDISDGWHESSDDDRNTAQKQFECCGFLNATDFPGSKCPAGDDIQSCEEAFRQNVNDIVSFIIAVLIVTIVIEIVCMAMAVGLLFCLSPAEPRAGKRRSRSRSRSHSHSRHSTSDHSSSS